MGFDEAKERHQAWVADVRADRIRRTGQAERELIYDQPRPKWRKRTVTFRPELRDATVILRVPYEARDYHVDPEVVDAEVKLLDLAKALVDCIEGAAFGREDSVSLRFVSYRFVSYPGLYLSDVPDSIERERKVEVDS